VSYQIHISGKAVNYLSLFLSLSLAKRLKGTAKQRDIARAETA